MNDHRISRRSFLAAAGMTGAAAALTACGGAASSAVSSVASSAAASSEVSQSVELIVFAAASLTETLNAIGESYTAEHPEVTFRFNFDSSGTLKTQIQEGADCDLFISAGQKQMNQLDITASADVNKDGLDFVDADSRVNLLENKVVLAVAEGSDKGIDSFDKLAELLKSGGVIAIALYYGGANGYGERDAVMTWLETLDDRKFSVLRCDWANRRNDPPVPIFIWKD